MKEDNNLNNIARSLADLNKDNKSEIVSRPVENQDKPGSRSSSQNIQVQWRVQRGHRNTSHCISRYTVY